MRRLACVRTREREREGEREREREREGERERRNKAQILDNGSPGNRSITSATLTFSHVRYIARHQQQRVCRKRSATDAACACVRKWRLISAFTIPFSLSLSLSLFPIANRISRRLLRVILLFCTLRRGFALIPRVVKWIRRGSGGGRRALREDY